MLRKYSIVECAAHVYPADTCIVVSSLLLARVLAMPTLVNTTLMTLIDDGCLSSRLCALDYTQIVSGIQIQVRYVLAHVHTLHMRVVVLVYGYGDACYCCGTGRST
jgi:hypothetical protein